MNDKYILNIPGLSVLSRDNLEWVYLSTLAVLRRTDVIVKESHALEALEKGGCHVGGERVRIPANLVKHVISFAYVV